MIVDIGQGIKTNLETISDLRRVYAPDETPDSVNEFPAAAIRHTGTDYQQTMGGAATHEFTVTVFVTNQDSPSAFTRLLPFLEPSGDSSIVAALQADTTFDGSADDMTVVSNTGQSIISWAGLQYLGTDFTIEVWE